MHGKTLLAGALATTFLASGCLGPRVMTAEKETRQGTHTVLPTGNGHGFQLFDTEEQKLTAFLEVPYRYLRAPANLTWDGPERRNLLEEFSLGITRGGTRQWMSDWTEAEVRYLQETQIIEAEFRRGDYQARVYHFSPFGLEQNAMVALLQLDSAQKNATPIGGTSLLRFHLGDTPKSKIFWKATLDIVKLAGERVFEIANPDGTPSAWVEISHGKGAMLYVPLVAPPKAECHEVAHKSRPNMKMMKSPLPAISLPRSRLLCEGENLELLVDGGLDQGWYGVFVAYVEEATQIEKALTGAKTWIAGRKPSKILSDQLADFEKWRKPIPFEVRHEDERKLWRQSEAVLRMAQVREPNRKESGDLRVSHGMILAGLPPGNWPTAWVRDGSYATAALARMGHLEEAKKSLNFFLNAEPVGKFHHLTKSPDYRISVTRYYGSGEEEADYSEDTTPNVELDGWGLFLWAARQYVEHSGDIAWLNEPTRKGSVFEAMLEGVARPIEENLEEPGLYPRIMRADSSIWEVHDENKKHYAFTTLTAARGLCDFAALARKAGRADVAKKYAALAREMKQGLVEAFHHKGALLGAVERSESTDRDAAVIEAFTFDVWPDRQSELARRTLQRLEELRLPTGGYSRSSGRTAYDINEWLFVNFRLASLYYQLGDRERVDPLIDRIIQKSSRNFYLLPELYNVLPADGPVGGYTGSVPMVGYGAGALVSTLLDRAGKLEKRDCGE